VHLKSKEKEFMRLFRIIGVFLSIVALCLLINWLFNTLMPLNRLNSLQPVKLKELKARSSVALLECYVSRNWTTQSPEFLLNCDGNEVRVQRPSGTIYHLSSKVVATGQKKAIAASDPIVIVGKWVSDDLGKDRNAIQADLLAYGNRRTNLSIFQFNGVLQIMGAELAALLGILFLFIDWRMPKNRCNLGFGKFRQSRNTSLFSYYKLFDPPLPQCDRPQVDQIK
jgi:hypothetical protein